MERFAAAIGLTDSVSFEQELDMAGEDTDGKRLKWSGKGLNTGLKGLNTGGKGIKWAGKGLKLFCFWRIF